MIETETQEVQSTESYVYTFVATSGEYIKFNIDLPLGQMEERSSDSVFVRRTIEQVDEETSHRFYIKMAPRGSKANWIDRSSL